MKIIPVIDLMNGAVVHARRGERDNYSEICSTLCPSAAPEAILQAFVDTFACATVYIADLDAIRFQLPQIALIEKLKRRFPAVHFWLDAGITDQQSFFTLQSRDLATPVIGSESLKEIEWLAALDRDAWIVSFDFKENEFLGNRNLLKNHALWPRCVLAMNLARVGSESGPDLELLNALTRLKPDAEIYAAGGVRDSSDLKHLHQLGVQGALVATALHNGSITQSSAFVNSPPHPNPVAP